MKALINFIKTLYFNFRYLPLKQALCLPIYVTTNLGEIQLHRGQLILKEPYRKSVIIGACGSAALQQFKSGIHLSKGATLIFNGMTVIAEGCVLRCDKDSSIEFGKDFYCNKNCFFRSSDKITFGDGCSLGWNVQINTNNGHPVWSEGDSFPIKGPVKIGNHVWITSNVIIGKNVDIANGCIIAQGSVVSKKFEEEKSLIGGVPATIIKKNIQWASRCV